MNIFHFSNYVDFLNWQIEQNSETFGYKTTLAKAANCQKSFLSNVLNQTMHLSLEQAARLGKYWRLPDSEFEYFMELVSWARSDSSELKDYLKKRLKALKTQNENLIERFQTDELMLENQASFYYSHWWISAIHILISSPQYRQINSISERLHLSKSLVQSVLSHLQSLQIVDFVGNEWRQIKTTLHISKNSPFSSRHHQNWRSVAVQNSQENQDSDLHYTSVFTMNEDDVDLIKNICLQFLDQTRIQILPSEEKELYSLNLDFFKI